MKRLFVLFLSLFFLASTGSASPVFTSDDNIAIRGYDSVAYFTEGKALKGDPNHSFAWDGATWHFASEKNLNLFKASPEKYAPQYGGYCAWGLAAKNQLFPVNPESWKVVDGKLYLNYDSTVQEKWLADTSDFISKANTNWHSHMDHGHEHDHSNH